MSEGYPGAYLQEEPQEERGEPGSRDRGGPPGAGPVERPAGDPHGSATGVDRQGVVDDGMNELPAP